MENMNVPAVHKRRCRIYYDGFWLVSLTLSNETPDLHQSALELLTRESVCLWILWWSVLNNGDGFKHQRQTPPLFLHQTWPHHFSPLLNVLVLPSEATGWIVSCLLNPPRPHPPTPSSPSSFCQRKQLPPCRLLFWQLREERWKVLNHCRKLFCIQMVSMLNLPYRQWFCCAVAKG